MDATTKEAIRVLGIYTAGRFDVWQLMGPAKASCRAHVMSAMMGRRIPQSKSGVTAIRAEFYRRLELDGKGGCEAERENMFKDIARASI